MILKCISPDAPADRRFARRWIFYLDRRGRIAAIDETVKAESSGRDIVEKLKELNVPKR